jgi:hypothetical protein
LQFPIALPETGPKYPPGVWPVREVMHEDDGGEATGDITKSAGQVMLWIVS